MASGNTIGKTLMKPLEYAGKFLANSGHAQQDIPSQHRLLNAGVMFGGWWALDQVRHIAFGLKMKSEGEYVDVPIEEVPVPLRFLHKTIDWDPHSEAPEHQWKKLMYQMLPGVGAGAGAAMGSIYAFQRNGREQIYKATIAQKTLSLLDADYAAQYAQSTPLRALSAFFGTFSAASGLTFMYGLFLNPAFAAANGAKIFTGSLSKGNAGPVKAVEAQLEMVGSYVQEALKTGKMNDALSEQFVERVLQPLFGHELQSAESQAKAVKTLQGIVEKSYQKFAANGKPAKEIAEAVTKDLAAKLGKGGLDATLINEFGLDPKNATLGNANPIIRQFHGYLNSIGIGKTFKVGEQTSQKVAAAGGYGYALPVIGVGAGLGIAATATGSKAEAATVPSSSSPPLSESASPGAENAEKTQPPIFEKHPTPDATGKSAKEYAYAAMEMHTKQNGINGQPPALLKWMGDAQLAVLPKNRMFSAIGLTTGLMVAGNMAKIATGFGLDKKPVDASKIPTYLHWMKGIVKDYNPKGLRPRDKWINYAQWAVYSLGGFAGIKAGTDFAYSNVHKKNKDPQYLEDYLPRISMHQGDNWSWLAASAGIFGSASGLFAVPVPGINYALGLAGRTTSMQDRNFMIGGVNEAMSGATTTSFMRLREGMNFLCHHAVNNPAENPSQIEYLAYTMLGPLFKKQLTAEHIQRFTEAVHEARDPYWEEGGIPKNKRKAALKTMREVFTGAGQEILLIDLGLNPGSIKFDELNGMSGKIGNIGIIEKIHEEQKHYHEALQKRLVTYVEQGLISQAQADWVKAGIEAVKNGQEEPPPPVELESPAPATEAQPTPTSKAQPQKTFSERTPKKQEHFHDLIKRSEEPGDWRKKAGLREEGKVPAVMGG